LILMDNRNHKNNNMLRNISNLSWAINTSIFWKQIFPNVFVQYNPR